MVVLSKPQVSVQKQYVPHDNSAVTVTPTPEFEVRVQRTDSRLFSLVGGRFFKTIQPIPATKVFGHNFSSDVLRVACIGVTPTSHAGHTWGFCRSTNIFIFAYVIWIFLHELETKKWDRGKHFFSGSTRGTFVIATKGKGEKGGISNKSPQKG